MTKAKRDLCKDITDRFIEQMENGVIPWVQPWKSNKPVGTAELPFNGLTGQNYHGCNILILLAEQFDAGYQSNIWMTFNQAKQLGGKVRKGEHATWCAKFGTYERENKETGEKEKGKYLTSFALFNVEQIDGLEGEVKKPEPIRLCFNNALQFALNAGAEVRHGGDSAFYTPSHDFIQMPPQADFKDMDNYGSTMLHELTHWTNHKTRTDRKKRFKHAGKQAYAFEELIAELGSAYLCSALGIKLEGLQHASYLDSWIAVLKNDKRALFEAAKFAGEAFDYLLATQQQEEIKKAS